MEPSGWIEERNRNVTEIEACRRNCSFRVTSYERKPHVLRRSVSRGWNNVISRYLRVILYANPTTHHRPLSIHKFPLFFRYGVPIPPLFLQNIRNRRSSVSSSKLREAYRCNVSLSLSARHRRSPTTVNHVARSRQGTTKPLGKIFCDIRMVESRDPRKIWNWSSIEGKKRRRVGEKKIPSRGKERFEIPVPSSSSMST